MNKYKRLISNTLIFAIGTFSSKVLSFLLTPLLSYALSPAEFSITNMIVDMGNLLLPIVTLGIINSIIRFGLDKSIKKSDVFSTGFFTILFGFLLLLVLQPVIVPVLTPVMEVMEIDPAYVSKYMLYLVCFVGMSSMRSLFSQFTRARGMVRLFAVDGILSTFTTVLFSCLYVMVFHMGVVGYISAIITSDACSVVFLALTTGNLRYLRPMRVDHAVPVAMLKYSIPMVPNTIFWWITNISNRFLIAAMMSQTDAGLYVAAYKVPNLIVLVSGIFMDAWQMSAVTETKGKNRFFSRVFTAYYALMFMAASGVILFSKVITHILVAEDYYPSWQYIPLLVVATVFTCLVNFLGSIYMMEKKSVHSLMTAIVGAGVNIGLNFALIPLWGVNGSVLAMLISYLVVFLIRMVDTKRYVRMRISSLRLTVNTLLLLVQAVLMIFEVPLWILWEILLTALMLVLNMKEILESVMKILHRGGNSAGRA